MKVIHQEGYEKFPLFCRENSHYTPCVCVDLKEKEVWAESRPKQSESVLEFEGQVKRIPVLGWFLDDKEIINFLKSIYIQALLDAYVSKTDEYEKEEIAQHITRESYDYLSERIVAADYADYVEKSELTRNDIFDEIKESNGIRGYVEDLLSCCGNVYIVNDDFDDVMNDVIEYLK